MPKSTTFPRTFLTPNITNLCTRLTDSPNGSVAFVTLPHAKQLFGTIHRNYFCSWHHASRQLTLRLFLSLSLSPCLSLCDFFWPIHSLHFDTSLAEFDHLHPPCLIRLHFLIHFFELLKPMCRHLHFTLLLMAQSATLLGTICILSLAGVDTATREGIFYTSH